MTTLTICTYLRLARSFSNRNVVATTMMVAHRKLTHAGAGGYGGRIGVDLFGTQSQFSGFQNKSYGKRFQF